MAPAVLNVPLDAASTPGGLSFQEPVKGCLEASPTYSFTSTAACSNDFGSSPFRDDGEASGFNFKLEEHETSDTDETQTQQQQSRNFSYRTPPKELPFTLEEYAERLRKTRASMAIEGLELLLLTEPEDIFYLTAYQTVGAPQVQALLVPADAAEEMYFVTRRLEVSNAEYRSILWKYFSYDDYEVGIDKVCDLIQNFSPGCKVLGVQEHSKRISLIQHRTVQARLASLGGGCKIVDCSSIIAKLRLVKSRAEIAVISKAASFCAAGVRSAQTKARPGMMEASISSLVYQGMMDLGCEYTAYPPFICAGTNGCMGHYTGAQDKLKDGEILFLEIGGCYQRYHAAMMRTCFVGTVLPKELEEAQDAVAEAMEAAMAAMKPGTVCKDVDSVTRKILAREDKGWTNSLRSGYTIGIGFYTDWGEAHELVIDPASEAVLEEGMVLHLIPWVQLKQWGGVGLSDTVEVTPNGAVSVYPEDSRVPRKIALIPPSGL